MRNVWFVPISLAAGCAGMYEQTIDHVVAVNRVHEVHHNRGAQNIQYTSAGTGLTIGGGSTHVGDPSRVIESSGEATIMAAQADELRACAERMRESRAGAVECIALNHIVAQAQTVRVVARANGGYFLPNGGSWQNGQGSYFQETLDAVASAEAFTAGNGAYAQSGSRLPLRERVGRIEGRQRIYDQSQEHLESGVLQLTDPEGGSQ